jgi:hypothetical protein
MMDLLFGYALNLVVWALVSLLPAPAPPGSPAVERPAAIAVSSAEIIEP